MLDLNLKIGSVVTLNSGGQKMTVQAITMDGDVQCVWNNDSAPSLQERTFRADVLAVVENGAKVYDFTAARESSPRCGNGLSAASIMIDKTPAEDRLPTTAPETDLAVKYGESLLATSPQNYTASGFKPLSSADY